MFKEAERVAKLLNEADGSYVYTVIGTGSWNSVIGTIVEIPLILVHNRKSREYVGQYDYKSFKDNLLYPERGLRLCTSC